MKRADVVEAMARAIEAIAWNDDPSGEPLNAHEDAAELAQAALAAQEALGLVLVPAVDEAALVEIADDCGWSLSICFGHGDKNRDRMHAYSDALRAMLAASPIAGAPE
jgi:hypothetical protein